MKQTILHIGLEKTGTTSVQFLLRQNRDQLLKSSVLISKGSSSGNNFHLAIASYAQFRQDGLTRQLGLTSANKLQAFSNSAFQSLAAEIQIESPEKLILSSEHFQSRLLSVEDIRLLKSKLEGAGCENISVLVYLRDPLKIATSHHGMAIKKGIHVTEDFYRPQHPRISHIIDHKKTLGNWAEVFGAENLDVRLYPEDRSSEVLIEDFLEAVGIEKSQLDLSKQEVRNVNLSALALETLNDLNSRSNRVRLLAEDRWLFNRLERNFAGRGLSPSPETVALFTQRFAADHAEIARRWFGSGKPLFDAGFKVPHAPEGLDRGRTAAQIEGLVARAMLRRGLLAPIRLGRRLLGGPSQAKRSA